MHACPVTHVRITPRCVHLSCYIIMTHDLQLTFITSHSLPIYWARAMSRANTHASISASIRRETNSCVYILYNQGLLLCIYTEEQHLRIHKYHPYILWDSSKCWEQYKSLHSCTTGWFGQHYSVLKEILMIILSLWCRGFLTN